jgi:hypothetical protein
MPALAELSPGVSRNGHLVSINCGYFDFRAMEKRSSSRPAISPRRTSTRIAVSRAFAADNSRILDSLSNLRNLSRSGSPKRIANSAEVSITTRTTVGPFVARRAVLIVA